MQKELHKKKKERAPILNKNFTRSRSSSASPKGKIRGAAPMSASDSSTWWKTLEFLSFPQILSEAGDCSWALLLVGDCKKRWVTSSAEPQKWQRLEFLCIKSWHILVVAHPGSPPFPVATCFLIAIIKLLGSGPLANGLLNTLPIFIYISYYIFPKSNWSNL